MPVDKLDITWENLKEKLLEAAEGRGPLQGELVTEENVDKVIEIFKELNKKQDSAASDFCKDQIAGKFSGRRRLVPGGSEGRAERCSCLSVSGIL